MTPVPKVSVLAWVLSGGRGRVEDGAPIACTWKQGQGRDLEERSPSWPHPQDRPFRSAFYHRTAVRPLNQPPSKHRKLWGPLGCKPEQATHAYQGQQVQGSRASSPPISHSNQVSPPLLL